MLNFWGNLEHFFKVYVIRLWVFAYLCDRNSQLMESFIHEIMENCYMTPSKCDIWSFFHGIMKISRCYISFMHGCMPTSVAGTCNSRSHLFMKSCGITIWLLVRVIYGNFFMGSWRFQHGMYHSCMGVLQPVWPEYSIHGVIYSWNHSELLYDI